MSKKRIIINYDDGLNIEEVIERVADVVKMGRISNYGKQFCYMTTIEPISADNVNVYSGLTQTGTDTFFVNGAV